MRIKINNFLKTLFKNKSNWITIIFPVILLGIFLFLMTMNNVYTETYEIERFNQSKQTIRSPITIENEQETERKTREAFQAIEDKYSTVEEITEERVEYIDEIFDAIIKLDDQEEKTQEATEDEKEDEDEDEENVEEDQEAEQLPLTNREKVLKLRQILSSEIIENVDETVLIQLVRFSEEDREEGRKLFVETLSEILENGVRDDNIQSSRARIKDTIKYSNLDEELKPALINLIDFAVVENSFFDVDKTREARKEAVSNLEPVVINAGEVIVREGQTITNEIYEELKLAGLLNAEKNIYPVIGLSLLIILIISIVAYEINLIKRDKKLNKREVFSVLLISIIVISLMKVVSLFTSQINQLFFIVPIATGVLLIKQLINERMAIVLAALYAILGSVVFNGEIPGSLNVEAGIYFYLSQLAGIIFLNNVKDRLAIVKSGIGLSIVNIITVLIFIFLSFEKYTLIDILTQSGFGIVAAMSSVVLTIGLMPFFESGLGILTDMRLLTLSNPNQPLLKKLLVEAPGTYHHSIMVANLSESACEAIGANGLLARVGAYYHDIGKTVRPHYFIENQLSINNPHDVIAPKQSADIIISHPYDGADMLRKYRLPQEVIDIAEQHHGTSLLKYFYFKEKEHNKEVKEENYRYPGPKPQTKEAAIICICDAVEAAVRSLKEPTEEKIDEIVSSIVNDRLQDGQFDESPLTLQDLKIVRTTVCETLKGFFHSRIQYPMEEAK